MRRILACLAALAIALLPLGAVHAGNHWQAPVKATAPEGNHWQFVGEEPLGKGLHLLADTQRIAYGNLTPLAVTKLLTITVPASVDLSRYDVPVGDQAYIGSCTSWAASYTLVGWWLNKEGLYNLTGPMAPMYTYHQVNGGADQGSWAYINLNADLAGMVPMETYPQGNYDWKTAPTGTQMALAHQVRITGGLEIYQTTGSNPDPADGGAVSTRADLMNYARYQLEWALAHSGPVDLELTVRGLMDNATAQTAYVPRDPSPVLGGHNVVAVGYDQYGLWVQNQWGTGWGLNGYAELSWDYVLDNVEGGYVIKGVSVAPSFKPAPIYRGIPSMTLAASADGVPTGDSVLHKDQEEVFAVKGLRPGDVVREYVDGQYRQYMTATPQGTVSDEIYWHPETGKEGPHAVLFTPGWHTVKVVDQHGDWASAEMQVG